MDRLSFQSTTAQSSTLAGEDTASSTRAARFENAVASASRRAMQYEHQMKDFEASNVVKRLLPSLIFVQSKLAEDLSNSRAIDTILREVVQGLQHTQRRSAAALSSTVPYVAHALQDDLAALQELGAQLPEIGRQVRHIREVYDRGRDKAKDLEESLEWLNTPVPLRLRTIIFTPNAPVSPRWKALIRFLFALVFSICMWIAWITLRGAVRAHRQRLVWGEGLMS
ncbi:hypothetical protein BC835DRAFT_1410076 [Cytidiella melzeri]|nr:hypothetical protein BC835DRAFT_1410076 [Cytidiella melzeri]